MFEVETADGIDVVDVTRSVAAELPAGYDGPCTVFVRHTTAAVVVTEAEARLLDDLRTFLGRAVADEGWDHDALDGNADAHLRAALLGPSVTVPVRGGDPALGRWQSVLLVDCDGPRTRTVDVCTRAGSRAADAP